jgi:peroxiredoxin Q/BCP
VRNRRTRGAIESTSHVFFRGSVMAKKKAKKSAKKSSKKAAKKSAKKGAKKASKKSAKKAVKKPMKKAVRKAAKKAPRAPRRTPAAAPPPAPVTPPPPPTVELNPGDSAPDFSLSDESGRRHTLSQYRGQTVVLYFYPKDDTPGCTTEACQFRDALGSFSTRNAVVLGVSPDDVGSHQRFAQKYGLTFPILADEDHAVAERYGVWAPKSMHGKSYMGVARTTFVIRPDGTIKNVVRNVNPEGHDREVLNLI